MIYWQPDSGTATRHYPIAIGCNLVVIIKPTQAKYTCCRLRLASVNKYTLILYPRVDCVLREVNTKDFLLRNKMFALINIARLSHSCYVANHVIKTTFKMAAKVLISNFMYLIVALSFFQQITNAKIVTGLLQTESNQVKSVNWSPQ